MKRDEDEPILLRPDGGQFDFHEGPAFAANYLRTYYEQPPTADETAVTSFLAEELHARPVRGTFVELGCGPTVHHVFPFAPYADTVHMADYLEDNLDQVRLWRAGGEGAHDWTSYVRLALEFEDGAVGEEEVRQRASLTRGKIAKIFSCDLKEDTPVELVGAYDAVGCFYCIEEIGISLAEWRRVLGHAVAYLKPGGTFYMAALGGMSTYFVVGASGERLEYPCANLSEADVSAALEELGFSPQDIRLKTTRIAEPDCEVTATILAAARMTSGDQEVTPTSSPVADH